METLEYYQLKDELGKELRDQIQASISSERELQQKYIGLGIKIAIVGLGAAVLAIGIFGIKSAYDLNSAIKSIPARIDRRADSEVQKRFDSSTNPIPKYESLLRDSAGRSIAASINAQTRNPVRSIVLLDESTSSTIADCLNNCATASTKLLLISALSTTRVRTVNPAIDQGALAVLTNLSADHPINSRGLAQVIQYLSVRSPERFADDIRKVYEVHGDVAQVQSAIAKYLYKLKKDSGKELAEKLAKTGNDNTKLLLHIRDLRNGTVTQPNVALLKHAVESAFDPDDDTMDVDDVVDYMTDINDQGSNPEGAIGSFVDLIREIASSRNLSFAAGNFLAEQDSFLVLLEEVVMTLE